MSRKILDIESSNLLQAGLSYLLLPFKLKPTYSVWCIVIRDVDTDEVLPLRPHELTKANLKKALEGATEIIGHNIAAFDLPVLMLMGLLEYSIGYPGKPSTVFGTEVTITDTLIWSKLLNADRLGGHGLDAWGKRLGEAKGIFNDWSKFSEEMLTYCIQDTNVNKKVFLKLKSDAGTWDWSKAYSVELKLADLTLKQELFGFSFDRTLAEKNISQLDTMMQEISELVNPILPPKLFNASELKEYVLPVRRFKKDGTPSSYLLKFMEKHNAELNVEARTFIYEGRTIDVETTEALKTSKPATVNDIDVVKSYLLGLGWVPSEIKERDLVKNQDKTVKNHAEIVEAIDRYVKQTESSLFKDLRCEALDTNINRLRSFLISRIDGAKPIYVPTTPKLTVGVEKEICPHLISLGEKAEFVSHVVKFYTYKHRRNSIAGGDIDEDTGEPSKGFISFIREDGRVPTPADTLGANTGRYRHKIICNIPRVTSIFGEEMRNMFGCGKGLFQLGYDFASLEARIMGHYVIGHPSKPYPQGVELANALVAEKPLDVHSLNAKKLGIDRSSAKSFSYACLPMQTKVLTKHGWKFYGDINEGDTVLTYNPDTKVIEDDVVLKKHFFTDKEVNRYGNARSSFECTEDHRWYGYRRSKSKKGSKMVNGFFTARDFTQEHNILLTAPYKGGNSAVTPEEAALMGYILSDGSYKWSTASERTSASGGRLKGVRVEISQSLGKFHDEIELLLNKLGISYCKSKVLKENGNDCFSWVLSSPDARKYLDRVVGNRLNKHEVNWSEWVCNLTREALVSFYEAFYNGDGCVQGTSEVIYQNEGNILDAVVTAAQLIGKGRITFNEHEGCNARNRGIRVHKRNIMTMQKVTKTSLGVQDTFCLTTKNSTFIIWQDDFVGITGNCIYGAQPKKLAKMLGVSTDEAKRLFSNYWNAVPALKALKENLEKFWEANGKTFILGLDGRKLQTRSKHSLINVLFQSGGAISAKWSAVYKAEYLEERGLLGNPFEDTLQDLKVWWMIHVHDEQQLAVHPRLLEIKSFATEEEAKEFKPEGCSAIGHGSKGYYVGLETEPVKAIAFGINRACKELNLRVDLGFEWIPGLTWGMCH